MMKKKNNEPLRGLPQNKLRKLPHDKEAYLEKVFSRFDSAEFYFPDDDFGTRF